MVYKVAKFGRNSDNEYKTISEARKCLKKLGQDYKIFKYQKHLKTVHNDMFYTWEMIETFSDLK